MKYNRKSARNTFLRRNLLICLIFSTLLFLSSGLFSLKFASAVSPVSTELYLPKSMQEYCSLTSPTEVFYSDDYLIINDNKELLISKNSEGYIRRSDFTNLSYVKSFDKDNILLTDNGSIYKYSLTDYSKTPIQHGGYNIGSDFDYNGNYLITSSSNKVIIYTLSGSSATIVGTISDTSEKTPVAINSQNKIFYLKTQNMLRISAVDSLDDYVEVELPVSPTKIIANDDRAFIINETDSKVYSVSLGNDYSVKTLSADGDINYDLSNVKKTSGICFKGENLLIADADLKAVSEFTVLESSLSFTGFAVAKGKTAYNRIGAGISGSDIYTMDKKTAVFDGYKITVYDEDGNFDNILLSAIEGLTVDRFALGVNTLALSNEETRTVRVLNLTDKSNKFGMDITVPYGRRIKGLKYLNGYYYLLVILGDTAASGRIYTISESSGELKEVFGFSDLYTVSDYPEFAVTVTGDFYITDVKNKKILCYREEDGYAPIDFISLDDRVYDIVKLGTDMGGALFALTSDSVIYFNEGITEIPLSLSANAISFALNYDEKKVSFIFDGEELVYRSESLPNMAANDFTVPIGYTTSGESANIDNLKIYSVTDSANVYSVKHESAKDKFIYLGKYVEEGHKYAFIDKIEYVIPSPDGDSAKDRVKTFFALATLSNKKDPITVIVLSEETVDETDIKDATIEKAFISTDVNMYYIPIITENDSFAIYRGGNLFRLPKNTEIAVLKSLEFIGRTFYYCSYVSGGETVNGYIPKNFTVEILSDDILPEDFVYGTLKKTTVYKDEGLTEKLKDVADNTRAKIINTNGNITEVAIEEDGVWIKGYVKADQVIIKPNDTVRNVLIIVALSISVFATSLFIILRKKG